MPEPKPPEAICAAIRAREDAWLAVCSGSSYVPLLPVLEHHHAEVCATLVDCLTAAGIPRAEASGVSLSRLVVFALTAGLGRGWALDAVRWCAEGFPIDDDVATALEHLSQQKCYAQPIRHQAFAAAKRWRRAQLAGA